MKKPVKRTVKKPVQAKAKLRTITWDDIYHGGQPNGVNAETALGLSAFWCGVRVIAEGVGGLKPVLYRRKGEDSRERVSDHPVARLLTNPNPLLTRPVYFETSQAMLTIYGNSFSEIVRDGAGNPVELYPILPTAVSMNDDGTWKVGDKVFRQEDILHVPGLCVDGSGIGAKLLHIARKSIEMNTAANTYGRALFKNLCRPGGILEAPDIISDEAWQNIESSFKGMFGGENYGAVGLLEQGVTFKPFDISNDNTQFEPLLRQMNTVVAQLLNVQTTKLHSMEKATWGNLETLNQDFLTTTLRPSLVKWEAEMERKFLTPAEREEYYIEFFVDSVYRADLKTRNESYKLAIEGGWLTIDEVRAKEGLPKRVMPAPQPTPTPQGEANATSNP
jgi:HK97 family phage portal protein